MRGETTIEDVLFCNSTVSIHSPHAGRDSKSSQNFACFCAKTSYFFFYFLIHLLFGSLFVPFFALPSNFIHFARFVSVRSGPAFSVRLPFAPRQSTS
jgi:hypothetical protein